jgi:hypothetical protein
VAELTALFDRGRKTDTRAIKLLPIDPVIVESLDDITQPVRDLIAVFAEKEYSTETSALFIRPWSERLDCQGHVKEQKALMRRASEAQASIDESAQAAFGIEGRIDNSIENRQSLVSRAWSKQELSPRHFHQAIVSYLVGVSFGRWDLRIASEAESVASRLMDPFASVPAVPPAMLGGGGESSLRNPPVGYPLELPQNGLLVDEPGRRWDLVACLNDAAKSIGNSAEAALEEGLNALDGRTLRDYLRKGFFKSHLSQYSKSRRKAPIYWQLTVPTKSWGVWIYAPALSRETLYEVASEAARRERLAAETIARLQREQQEGGNGPLRQTIEQLDAELTLAEELRLFRTEAKRVAGLGWEPTLDDGIVLCAAPLADLFPAWPEATKVRDKLRGGHYDWAAVARWAGEL